MNTPIKTPVTEQALYQSVSFLKNSYKWMNAEENHTNNMLTK